MNLLQTFQKRHTKKKIPPIKVGDVVRIHEKIIEGKKERIQVFEGIIIAIHKRKSLDATFTVRKVSFGIGVEKTFPLHLPTIAKIEKIKAVKVRRAKLYYLRGLTDKQLGRQQEFAEYSVWKDERAEAEEKELKKKKEEEVVKKAESKRREQEKLDKKFARAQAAKQVQVEERKDDGENPTADNAEKSNNNEQN